MGRQSTAEPAPTIATAADVLAWYDRARRELPWRSPPGTPPDPYHVWLSEIMLQQTTTATVAPYYREFLARWPRIEGLAAAPLDAVLHAWQGLGYYARARNLHRCARRIVEQHGGQFPESEDDLTRLSGIGPYTAAAISAIAFDRKATVVDGNVERVMARLFAVHEPLPGAKPRLRQLAATLTPDVRPGDYAQAVMDLGATVCAPRNPKCALCPWAGACLGRAQGIAAELPRRSLRAAKPTRRGLVFWVARPDGSVLLRRRADEGLLGGLMEVPSTPWREKPWETREARAHAPLDARWRRLPGVVRHTFTHFNLELGVLAAEVRAGLVGEGEWCSPNRFGEHALPTVMKKVVRHALGRGRRHGMT